MFKIIYTYFFLFYEHSNCPEEIMVLFLNILCPYMVCITRHLKLRLALFKSSSFMTNKTLTTHKIKWDCSRALRTRAELGRISEARLLRIIAVSPRLRVIDRFSVL